MRSLRFLDVILSLLGLAVFGLPILILMLLVYLQDRHSPIYKGVRAARGGGSFEMMKLRSMIMRADQLGASSTAADDRRITKLGHFIRRFKLDELTQLVNVLRGDMSFVGPRPQVLQAVATYSSREKNLLRVRPGITDLASIVFADEGEILRGSKDPDADYDRLIRPWKGELALLFVERASVALYFRIIFVTIISIIDRQRSLQLVSEVVRDLGGDESLISVSSRKIRIAVA